METNGQKDSVYSNLAKVALEESEEKFRIFMENTQEGVVIHDRFKILETNQAFTDLFGHKKEFIIGNSFLKLKILAPDQIHRAARSLALNILGKPVEPEEFIIQRHDGRQIPVEISARPLKINEKRMWFGIVRDITQKKKIEKALHQAIKEIESLVEKRTDKEKGARGKSKNKPQAAEDTISI